MKSQLFECCVVHCPFTYRFSARSTHSTAPTNVASAYGRLQELRRSSAQSGHPDADPKHPEETDEGPEPWWDYRGVWVEPRALPVVAAALDFWSAGLPEMQ